MPKIIYVIKLYIKNVNFKQSLKTTVSNYNKFVQSKKYIKKLSINDTDTQIKYASQN